MDDDEPKPEKRYPVAASKLSKTPSWIMLGFLLGAIFVAALPPFRKKPAPEAAAFRAVEPPKRAEPREPPQLTTIEAVFDVWGKHAVWSDDVTEVALWNDREKEYSDYFEVRRFGDMHYFRTIPRLTRRIIARGKPIPESPLLFTETEEQYREWQKYGRSERAAERTMPARPSTSGPAPLPPPVDRSVKIEAPALPSPQFPPPRNNGKN
jgi:hypothetical protein